MVELMLGIVGCIHAKLQKSCSLGVVAAGEIFVIDKFEAPIADCWVSVNDAVAIGYVDDFVVFDAAAVRQVEKYFEGLDSKSHQNDQYV